MVGFTLLELLVVLCIIALASAGAVVAMRDSDHRAIEEEAVRLAALLEAARAHSRATGVAVVWQALDGEDAAGAGGAGEADLFAPVSTPAPAPAPAKTLPAHMRWHGYSDDRQPLARHWLHADLQVSPRWAVLGPDPVIVPLRLQLRLARAGRTQVREVWSDGVSPFAVAIP